MISDDEAGGDEEYVVRAGCISCLRCLLAPQLGGAIGIIDNEGLGGDGGVRGACLSISHWMLRSYKLLRRWLGGDQEYVVRAFTMLRSYRLLRRWAGWEWGRMRCVPQRASASLFFHIWAACCSVIQCRAVGQPGLPASAPLARLPSALRRRLLPLLQLASTRTAARHTNQVQIDDEDEEDDFDVYDSEEEAEEEGAGGGRARSAPARQRGPMRGAGAPGSKAGAAAKGPAKAAKPASKRGGGGGGRGRGRAAKSAPALPAVSGLLALF